MIFEKKIKTYQEALASVTQMICWVSHQALLYKAVKHSYFHPNMASSTFRSELIELMH
jgi:hypothetical protein